MATHHCEESGRQKRDDDDGEKLLREELLRAEEILQDENMKRRFLIGNRWRRNCMKTLSLSLRRKGRKTDCTQKQGCPRNKSKIDVLNWRKFPFRVG